jgi:hypothetical protein
MSAKNKLQNKKLRKVERAAGDSAWSQFQRTPLSGFPREAAVKVLALPFPAKSTAPRRKRLIRALSSAISVPRIKPKDSAVKLTVDLQRVSMVRLIRVIKKSARHAATCKYLAGKCTPGSQIQQNLATAQVAHLGVMRQARAEYNVRVASAV